MYNNSSSSFATVFFLVALFIGVGVLAYHTYDITVENGQLMGTISTLEAKLAEAEKQLAELKPQNEDLKAENAGLKDENVNLSAGNVDLANEITDLENKNAALTDENSRLGADLAKAQGDKAIMEDTITNQKNELEKLRLENATLGNGGSQQIESPDEGGDSAQDASPVLQSSIIPTNLESWVILAILAVAGILIVEVVLLVGLTKYGTMNGKVREMRADLSSTLLDWSFQRKNKPAQIIDSQFIDR